MPGKCFERSGALLTLVAKSGPIFSRHQGPTARRRGQPLSSHFSGLRELLHRGAPDRRAGRDFPEEPARFQESWSITLTRMPKGMSDLVRASRGIRKAGENGVPMCTGCRRLHGISRRHRRPIRRGVRQARPSQASWPHPTWGPSPWTGWDPEPSGFKARNRPIRGDKVTPAT